MLNIDTVENGSVDVTLTAFDAYVVLNNDKARVMVKFDTAGVAVDIYKPTVRDDDEQPAASAWAMYNELVDDEN